MCLGTPAQNPTVSEYTVWRYTLPPPTNAQDEVKFSYTRQKADAQDNMCKKIQTTYRPVFYSDERCVFFLSPPPLFLYLSLSGVRSR